MLGGLLSAVLTTPPAGATQPSAPAAKSTCQAGESLVALGLSWTCKTVNGARKMVAVGPSSGGAEPAGDLGRCRVGDWLTLGKLRLQCERVGKTTTWTGMRRGAVIGVASSVIQARPAKIAGACAASSSLTLVGIPIRCDQRSGASAWTTRPKSSSGGTSNVSVVPVPAGANKTTCVNAWWDKEFAGVVPQFTKRQDQALTDRIWFACHQSFTKFMTAAERDSIYAEFYRQLGQLVADEVQRVSAATGQNPCKAVETVLRPQYQPGFGLIGWDASGFLPILYKQWQGGPILGKLGGNQDSCATGQISVQLRRQYEGRHEGAYYPALGTPDATWPITPNEMEASWVKAATCLVWSPQFGNSNAGSAARVIGYNYTDMGTDGNMVRADFEVTKCEFKVAEAAGLPVVWKANANLNDMQTVTADYAGIWHTMGDNCSWSLVQSDTGARLSWTPADGPYTSIELKTGDQFASSCKLQKTDWEHMIIAPDGLMPLQTLSPGPRRPTTPGTCRYLVTDWSSLRNPPGVGALAPYAGSPVSFDTMVYSGGTSKVLRSVGCGRWELI